MIVIALAAVLAGAADLLLPGQVDLPLLAGARLAPDCLDVLPDDSERPALTCIAVPMRNANDMMFTYAARAKQQGWQDAGGAGTALFLSKPATAEICAQRLTLVAFWDPQRSEMPAPNEDVFIGMSVKPQDCKEPGQ